jgi:hypothetical protein
MENLNLHKLKLYSLIIAGVALIATFLKWISWSFGGYGGGGANGLRGWGLLSIIGIGVVAAACLMGDKTKDFDANQKKMAMGGFAAIAAGALLFFLRLNSVAGGFTGVSAGLGLWLCLAAGLAGLALTFGLIKIPDNTKKPPIS